MGGRRASEPEQIAVMKSVGRQSKVPEKCHIYVQLDDTGGKITFVLSFLCCPLHVQVLL